MSKVQKTYRDIEQKLKDNPGKPFIPIARFDLTSYATNLRSYQEEHRSCSVTLEKEEKTSTLATTTTEVQRFKAEIAQLRLENEELKTGSVSRTLGTPLADNAPEAADLSAALEQVRYLVTHPEYLRLATTRALTRTLSSFLTQAAPYVDDGLEEVPQFPPKSQAEGLFILEHTAQTRNSAFAHPGRAPRLFNNTIAEIARWLDDETSTRHPTVPGSPSKGDSFTVTHPTPEQVQVALTRAADYPTPQTPAPPSPVDTELVLTQEPLGPIGKRKQGERSPTEDDRARKVPIPGFSTIEEAQELHQTTGQIVHAQAPTGVPGQTRHELVYTAGTPITEEALTDLARTLRGDVPELTPEDLAAIAGSDSDIQIGPGGTLVINVSDSE